MYFLSTQPWATSLTWARTKHVGGGEVDWTSLSESAKEGRLFWWGGKLKIAGNEVIFAEMGSPLLNRRRMQRSRSPLSDEDLYMYFILGGRQGRQLIPSLINSTCTWKEEDENRPSYSFIQKYDIAAVAGRCGPLSEGG